MVTREKKKLLYLFLETLFSEIHSVCKLATPFWFFSANEKMKNLTPAAKLPPGCCRPAGK